MEAGVSRWGLRWGLRWGGAWGAHDAPTTSRREVVRLSSRITQAVSLESAR